MEKIKANELRIGNLVYGKNIETVKSIKDGYVWFDDDRNLLAELCEPIPLTEEWLFKFGFELNSNNNWSHWNFGLNFYKSGNFFESDQLPMFISLKYVNQLQNLYFGLTNEELCIK